MTTTVLVVEQNVGFALAMADRYLLLKQRIIATLVEVRVVGHRPARSISVPGRTKMYLGEDIEPRHIDYLYSELTCLE